MRRSRCMTELIEPTDAFEYAMRFYHAFQTDRANDQRSQHEQG